tara:strand:+ start:552 stop:938 length:387 start_codon:yes stop_codon:yes gene_type:complete
MKLPSFQPPNKIDHPGLPDAAYGAMEVLSNQVDKLTHALQKNISPEDNENTEVRIYPFESGVEYDITLQEVKGKVREVRVLDHDLFERVDLAWKLIDQKKIKVVLTWPSEPEEAINATLLIRGGSDGD